MHHKRKVTLIVEVDRQYLNNAVVKGEMKVVFVNGGLVLDDSEIPQNSSLKKELRGVLQEHAHLIDWVKFAIGGTE